MSAPTYRLSVSGFVRAWEAKAFDSRVELIDGVVWPVQASDWHGETSVRVVRALPDSDAAITGASLPATDSLLDPDWWVRRDGAVPIGHLGSKFSVWAPDDVLLVIEVSDDTLTTDLEVKPRLYGSAGYAAYWTVTPELIYEHTEPTARGYRVRREFRPGDRIPVRYAGSELAVDDLLG